MGLISSSAISAIISVDPTAIQQAAAGIRTSAAQIRNDGQQVVGTWKGLSAFYHAPESGQLLAAMTPLQTETDQFASQAEQVAAALDEFATTVAALKTKLDALAAQALTMVNQQSNDPKWYSHQSNVNAENAVIAQVNVAKVAYQAAEIRCANRINALDGGPQYAAGSPTNPTGVPAGMTPYGLTSIPTGTPTPWGTPSEKSPTWWDSTRHILWGGAKGIVVDGIGGTATGLFGMVNPFDWKTFSDSWTNLFNLGMGIDPWIYLSGGHQAHASAEAWKNFGKGLIAYDEWHKDYGRAAGIVVFNIGTLGVAELKLGKLGKVGDLGPAGKTLTVLNRATDPIYITRLGIKGTTYLAGKTADLIKIHATNLTNLEHLIEKLHATPNTPKATEPLPSTRPALHPTGEPLSLQSRGADHPSAHPNDVRGPALAARYGPRGGPSGHLTAEQIRHGKQSSTIPHQQATPGSDLQDGRHHTGQAKPSNQKSLASPGPAQAVAHGHAQALSASHDRPPLSHDVTPPGHDHAGAHTASAHGHSADSDPGHHPDRSATDGHGTDGAAGPVYSQEQLEQLAHAEQAARAVAGEHGVHVDFRTHPVDPKNAVGLAQAIRRMAEEYPRVFHLTANIKILSTEAMKGFDPHPGRTMAVTIHSGDRHPISRELLTPGVYIHQHFFADHTSTERFAAEDLASGFHVSGTAEGTFYHEFGHVLEHHLFNNQKVKNDLAGELRKAGLAVDDYSLHPANPPGWRPVRVGLGRYGAENPREFIAEAFAEWKLSPHPRPLATAVGTVIDKYFRGE